MNYKFYIFSLLIVLCGCNEEKYDHELLKGSWKIDTVQDSLGIRKDFYFINKPGLEFHSTSEFSYLPGPVNLQNDEQPKLFELIDTIINFEIKGDLIRYKSLKNNSTITKKITNLSNDSLWVLDNKKSIHKYVRIQRENLKHTEINKIVLSSSGCYGVCPIIDIQINRNGESNYYCSEYCGKEGFHSGELLKKHVEKLFDFIEYIDLDTLKNTYEANHTDDETITISFYNGKNLIKTISDYGRMAPTELIWIYTYLRYIPNLKRLKSGEKNPLVKPKHYLFLKDSIQIQSQRSESYYLYSHIRQSKLIDTIMDLPYKIYDMRYKSYLSPEYIKYNEPKELGFTDGRYFNLMSKENKILDLGFNYIENLKE
jgi:hypothetical protein